MSRINVSSNQLTSVYQPTVTVDRRPTPNTATGLLKLCHALEQVYRCDSTRYLCLQNIVNGRKETITVPHGPTSKDFQRHLSPKVQRGIGVFPGFQLSQGVGLPVCTWLALDIDGTPVAELQPLIEACLELGIYPYLTTGTTGRGSHLYVFLTEPIFQSRCFEWAMALANLARSFGIPKVELRPSSPSNSSGLFLPYRNGADGYGVNPLIDPETDAAVHLADLLQVTRTPASALDQLPELPDTVARSTGVSSIGTTSEPERRAMWQAELERLSPEWYRGRRNLLTMALAAYGIVGLGLQDGVVIADILALAQSAQDEELPLRKRVAVRTANRVRKGERVAWRTYYAQVGIEPPRSAISSVPTAKCEVLRANLGSLDWSTRSGHSERLVYQVLVGLASKVGKDHAQGVVVSVSLRELAEKAGPALDTVNRAVNRLVKRGLVIKLPAEKLLNSGSFVLVIDEGEKLVHSNLNTVDLPLQTECTNYYQHAVFMHGFLNASGAKLLVALLQQGGSCTRATLAAQTEQSPKTFRTALGRLLEHGIIVANGDRLSVTQALDAQLERVAVDIGATMRVKSRIERHQQEREEYQRGLSYSNARRPGT